MPFKSGKDWNGNANGRPKNPAIHELEEAIKTVEKKKKKTLLQHFVTRAFKEDKVLVAVMKKRVPDLSSVDMTVDVDGAIQIVMDGKKTDKPNKKK